MRSVRAALVMACLLLVSPVSAQVRAAAPEAPASRDVEVSVLGAEDAATPLDPAILEVARSLDLRVVSAGASARPVARTTIDLRGAEITLEVLDHTGQPITRRAFPRGPSAEVLREEIAIVLRDALAVAVERARTVEPATPPPPPPPAASAGAEAPRDDQPPPARVDAVTFFSARGHDANAGAIVGAGLGARVASARGAVRPGIGASFELDAPFDAPGAGVELRVAPYLARALPSLELPLGEAVSLDLVAGGGGDVTHVTPSSRSDRLSPRGGTTRVSPVLTGAIGVHARFGATSIGLLGGADADLAHRSYVVSTPGGPETALSPSRIRPFLQLTLAFALHGAD